MKTQLCFINLINYQNKPKTMKQYNNQLIFEINKITVILIEYQR